MKNTFKLLAIGAFGLTLAACSGNGSSNNPNPNPNGPTVGVQYTQIELLSRPAVKELFEKFVDHQVSNASEPYQDSTLQGEIKSFEDSLRAPNATKGSDYGAFLQAVLYPNEMIADISQTTPAGYLGYETKGASSATKSTFGGRAITDDVIGVSLAATFGNFLGSNGFQPEDNEENNCLSKQNITQNASQTPSTTFPYFHAPH